jgi:hypothetical protein
MTSMNPMAYLRLIRKMLPPDGADQGKQSTASPPQALAIAVAEAQQLLLHTVRHALPVPDEVLRSVIGATREADLDRWTDEEKTQFWKSAQALAEIVQPASSDSISSATADSGKHTTFFYSFMALALLVSLIVTQIFWVFGTTMTSNIDRLIDTNAKAETELLAAQARLSAARTAALGTTISAQSDIDLDKAVALNQILIKQNDQVLTADYILLDRWVSWMPVGFTASASTTIGRLFMTKEEIAEEDKQVEAEKSTRNQISLDSAKITLKAMSAYILPFLYGWLGAVAYVMRSLSNEIADLTYSKASDVRFRLRVVLGMLSGITVGLILSPEALPSSLSAITPLALAFLAGYSVELLFSAMDRLISAFSSETPRATGK